MKKWFLLLFVLGMSTLAFSQNNTNQLIGKWKYAVDTGSELLTGEINFTNDTGKLSGKAITAEGNTIPFSKVELKENNIFSIEIQMDSDILKVSAKLDNEKFSGTITSYQGEVPITGQKIIEP
jgi:hypothetical protein